MEPLRLQDGRVWVVPQLERAGRALGFTLDAEERVSAGNRLHRKRLCRYLLRPPLAKGRPAETMDGKYAFELRTPWSDGSRVIFFRGEELVARLAALVPPPRMHLVHFYGVLAPNAKLRKFVVPEAPPEGEDDPCVRSVAYVETRNEKTFRRRWVPWATLLLKVFAIDGLACPKRDGRMQRIAWITDTKVIRAILVAVAERQRIPGDLLRPLVPPSGLECFEGKGRPPLPTPTFDSLCQPPDAIVGPAEALSRLFPFGSQVYP